MVWTVTIKFSPVRMVEKPLMKIADRGGDRVRVAEQRAERRVKRPTRIHTADDNGDQHENRAERIDPPAQNVDPWKRQVARADHHRDQEVAQHRRDGRDQKKPDHDDAMHRKHLVVSLWLKQVALRRNQFQPDQRGEYPAHEEHERDGDEIQYGDALVVGGEQPGLNSVLAV